MKINWLILLIIFHISFCKAITFGDKQIIIMLNQYFEKSNSSQLLGHHFFSDKPPLNNREHNLEQVRKFNLKDLYNQKNLMY